MVESNKHFLAKKLPIEENNLCVQFVTTGQRPQNFIKNTDSTTRFMEYPKLNALIQEKTSLIRLKNHPPVYIKEDLKKYDLSKLGRFDVILIDPPWEEYEKRAKGLPSYLLKPERYKSWSLDELLKLPVEQIADNPSFVFLWVGSEHLDDGRELFKKWGYKRCEDIVWIKTNKKKDGRQPPASEKSILQRVKQHCLVGLKGDIKKASDTSFIHANIDIDVIVDEEPEPGSLRKPQEMYDIIERFCLGRKRLELFGQNHNIRDGWLTIGKLINETKFIEEEYNSWFTGTGDATSKSFKGGRLIGTNNMIENLRPKEAAKEVKNDEHQSADKTLSASKSQTG